jgi:hypothetical protein
MRATPIYASFNAGELSPLLAGRSDLEKYRAGLSVCENLIPRVQGALVRRGGTRFVAATKDGDKGSSDSDRRAWLVEFVFSATDSFVLEFGHLYVRFYRGRGVLQDSPGHAYELATPFTEADLLDPDDGSLRLKTVQSGDVLYLAHPKHPPMKLARLADTSWTLTTLSTVGGPFQDQNSDRSIGVYATGTGVDGSSVTLTASSGIFKAGHVGGLFYLEMADGAGIKPWEPGQTPAVDDLRRSDGKYYRCSAVPAINYQTGGDKPVHTFGKRWDGDGKDRQGDPNVLAYGVEWEYLHPGYGWVKITGFTDAQHVTATVLSRIPTELTSAANASWRWALPAWSDADGWPSDVTFFRERLTFARGRQLWFSVAGDFENFKAKDFGQTDLSSALVIDIQSGRGDPVKWLAPAQRLIVGTGGGEAAVGEQTANQAFGPGNAKADPQGEWGARGVAPLSIGASVLYVEKSGRAMRELAYDLNADGWASVDLTRFSEHLFSGGIVDMAFARQPHELVWCVRDDGALLAFTFNKADGVAGWHRHPIGGGGFVECVAVAPSPDGARDDVWLVVRRTVDGRVKRYVEWITPEWRVGDDAALCTSADASLTYQGAATSTLSGLSHLEGCVVSVKADGAAHADKTVAGGQIVLDRPATRAVVGLKAPARAALMPLNDGSAGPNAQGRMKRVNRLTVRLWNSLGCRFGPDFTTLERVEFRDADAPMDAAPPLFTGDKVVEFPGGYDARATVAFDCDQDFPFTLVALMPELSTDEG